MMGWAGYVAHMQEKRNSCRFLVGEKERDHEEDIDVGEMIILKCILGK
jgi:hypothetical protein